MALHELGTNAAKYGALSSAAGEVTVGWAVTGTAGEERLVLTWEERGGPPVVAPLRRGFGTAVIADAPRMQLRGVVTLEYKVAGLRWCLDVALANVVERGTGTVSRGV